MFTSLAFTFGMTPLTSRRTSCSRKPRSNFQGRYVLRHPWKGSADCPAGKSYFEETLPKRQKAEAQTLANLTGWDLQEIHRKAGLARAR